MLVARGQTADRRELGSECAGWWCKVIAHRFGGRDGRCCVLPQRVAACRVETTLRGWWAKPIELVGGGSVRVGGWSSRSRLFVRSFVRSIRSIRSGGILPHSNCGGI